MNADDFREIALSMEGAVERSHMGHPDFRANGRIFATLSADGSSGVVMLSPDEQQEFMRQAPKIFRPASGAWGRQGCTTILLEAANKPSARSAVLLAWERAVAQKPPRVRRSKIAEPRSPQSRARRRR